MNIPEIYPEVEELFFQCFIASVEYGLDIDFDFSSMTFKVDVNTWNDDCHWIRNSSIHPLWTSIKENPNKIRSITHFYCDDEDAGEKCRRAIEDVKHLINVHAKKKEEK